MPSYSSTLLFTLALGTLAAAKADAAAGIAALKTAANAVAKVNLLQDEDFVFDFFNPDSGVVSGVGGHAVGASVANFPALTGQDIAMTVGFLEPCGMNTPHTHPRATEILYSVNGTLTSGTIGENGSRFVYNTINPGQATIFPIGSVHYQSNEGCEPMTFVSAFNYEDPGTLSIAQRYLGLPPDVVAASLGNLGAQDVADIEAMLPDNFAIGRDECLQRCGLTRGVQPSTQRQPRVSGNALPSPSPSTASSVAKSATLATATPSVSRRGLQEGLEQPMDAYLYNQAPAVPVPVSVPVSVSAAYSSLMLGLVGAMGAGYVVLAVLYLRDRSRRSAVPFMYDAPAVLSSSLQQRYSDKPSVVAV